jgi:hypothetical protein
MKPFGAAFITFFRIRDQRRSQRQLSEGSCPTGRHSTTYSAHARSNELSRIQPPTSSNAAKRAREDDDDGRVWQRPLKWLGVSWRYAW